VAVRSSATAEDLPTASFAGQQETFLNVCGDQELLAACQRCFASLFTDRAISYREEKGFSHLDIALSIGVQRMVRSDRGGAGVMFTLDTETGFPRVILINAVWGLGETIVQGSVTPDQYTVFKPLLDQSGASPKLEKKLGAKDRKLIYATGGHHGTLNVATSKRERSSYVLEDAEILTLARWARDIERHYGRPMDLEWAKDGVGAPCRGHRQGERGLDPGDGDRCANRNRRHSPATGSCRTPRGRRRPARPRARRPRPGLRSRFRGSSSSADEAPDHPREKSARGGGGIDTPSGSARGAERESRTPRA
jgi:hypothetical protein